MQKSRPTHRILTPCLLAGLLLIVGSCARNPAPHSLEAPARGPVAAKDSDTASMAAKFLPRQHKVLLIIGQDLSSVANYVRSGYFPSPGGVTTYLAFYQLLSAAFPAYGALGEDPQGNPTGQDIDWGAGRLNANSAALAFRDSTLVIGLGIAEGNSRLSWATGEIANIGRGKHDDKIRRLAIFCKSIGKPIYLRIGYEFDGAWNRGYENPAAYIGAFRRIVDVMRSHRVHNVAYVWQASASPIDDAIDGRRDRITNWYPGDDYVDWMGLSWFLRPDEKYPALPTQRELADEILAFARDRRKPVMIAESAPQRYDLEALTFANGSQLWDGAAGRSRRYKTPGQIWREWYQPFFSYIEDNADVIRAVGYINADWDSQSRWSAPYPEGYWGDSRIETTPELRRAWSRQIGARHFWLHGSRDIELQLLD